MAVWQMMRPSRGRGQRNVQDLMNSAPVLASAFANPAIPQANLCGAILPATVTSPYVLANYPFVLEIPAGLFLDEYWDLAIDGSLLPNAAGIVAPSAAFVSPQYMGGGERVVVPQFNFAAVVSPTYDQGPIAATGALTSTVNTQSTTINARSTGVFASENPAELPPVFNWQYRRATKRYPIGAVSKVDIPITEYGQVLSTFVNIFDPALGTNSVGGYYNIANMSKCQLLYGSNLPRFDDDPAMMQNRFIEQHGFLPPQGTVTIWRQRGSMTTSRMLVRLTRSRTPIHISISK